MPWLLYPQGRAPTALRTEGWVSHSPSPYILEISFAQAASLTTNPQLPNPRLSHYANYSILQGLRKTTISPDRPKTGPPTSLMGKMTVTTALPHSVTQLGAGGIRILGGSTKSRKAWLMNYTISKCRKF